MSLNNIRRLILKIILLWFFFPSAIADVDKIYHPYVEVDTYEFETRIISLLDRELAAKFSIYRLGFGKELAENLFVEFYLIDARDTTEKFEVEACEVEACEVEALYQYTEQGEYWLDFGILLEIERERDSQEWEGNIGFLFEKEFGKWSASLNIHNQYLYEDDVAHKWELSQTIQWRYRYSPGFEPAVEIYSDSDDFFIGPVILGQVGLDDSKLNWEVGIVTELNHSSNESVLRVLVEREF